MDNQLKKLGVVRLNPKNCPCGHNAYVYRLPVKLDNPIIAFLAHMGKPAFSFEKTCLLKIENKEFAITGVKRLKEIRFSLKKPNQAHLITVFETALIKYVEQISKRK